MSLRGTRGETGRGSAGPRPRTLDRAEILARRDKLLALPKSLERTRGLARCRDQLATIRNRVEIKP